MRALLPAICAFLAFAAPAFGAAALQPAIRLTTGDVVAAPPPVSLDCDAIRAKLFEIDATGYRGLEPAPRDAADAPMLAYETELNRELYARCARRGLYSADAAG